MLNMFFFPTSWENKYFILLQFYYLSSSYHIQLGSETVKT